MCAVVFDLDGTLLHSAPDVLQALAEAMGDVGRPVSGPLPDSLIGPPVRGMLERLGLAPGSLEMEAAAAAFRRRYDACGMPLTRPYPGAVPLLEALRARGGQAFVATNKPSQPTRALLDRHFPGLIRGTSCVDQVPGRLLGKADMLRDLQERFGCVQAIVVGDGPGDILAGRELGWLTAAVTWGYADPASLEAAGPDRLFGSFEDLALWLEQA